MAKRIATQTLSAFPCTACGQCCRRVYLSEKTAYLNRGDGVCQYFNEENNLCSIYENRPLICRVDDYYQAHFSQMISWDDFVQLNMEICHSLQNKSS